MTGEVSSLKHELRDDTVEARAGVTETMLSGCKLTEVLRGLWDDVVKELEDDTAGGLIVNGNIKLKTSGYMHQNKGASQRCWSSFKGCREQGLKCFITHEDVGHDSRRWWWLGRKSETREEEPLIPELMQYLFVLSDGRNIVTKSGARLEPHCKIWTAFLTCDQPSNVFHQLSVPKIHL